jgi:hypothetical protein
MPVLPAAAAAAVSVLGVFNAGVVLLQGLCVAAYYVCSPGWRSSMHD